MGDNHNTSGQQDLTTLPVHPAAQLFPMMFGEDLGNLADDIAANGLMEPIVLYHGQILDGRNRLAACEMANVEPRFVEVDGELPSATIYVLSKNLHRRHLSISQRGAIGAESLPLLEQEAKLRSLSGLKHQSSSAEISADEPIKGRSREIIAKVVDVDPSTVQRASDVRKAAPEIFEQIKRGEITVDAARKQLPRKELPTKRARAVKTNRQDISTGRGKQRAEAHKRRMAEVMGAATGICEGLARALDIDLIRQVCTPEEIDTWATMAKSHAREFRRFAARLRGENGES